MQALSFVAVFLLSLGSAWTLTCAIGLTVGRHVGEKPEGKEDRPSSRYVYTTYGAYSRRSTLYAGLVLLALGLGLSLHLYVSGNFRLEDQ